MLELSSLLFVRHRVVNDFSLAHALLGMAMRRTDDPRSSRLFRASQTRLRAIALAYSISSTGGSHSPCREEVEAYLREIVREVELAHARSPRVRVSFTSQPVALGFAQMVALGLVLGELVGNALEHAFPGGRSGSVRVELVAEDEPGAAVLRVRDDGVGLTRSDAEGSPSLGLEIVNLMAEQLAGTLTMTSGESRGTDISLSFIGAREPGPWHKS